jgi:amylosucrase
MATPMGQAWQARARACFAELYRGEGHSPAQLARELARLVARHRAQRPAALKKLDKATPADWHRRAGTIAYSLYADLFTPEAKPGQHLRALAREADYFSELGVNLLHFLPLLKSSGDGGFAVDDYRQVDPRLGRTADLRSLIASLHSRGIRVALDFVLNHVSDRHSWAVAAARGDREFEPYFIWSETGKRWPKVKDVFPEFSPGHWDYVPRRKRYVWATFYKRRPVGVQRPLFPFAQWDLNYRHPAVLLGMVDNLLHLANWGVDVFRLDAISHLWKTRGTSCKGLPQVRAVLRLFRLALQGVAPRAVFLAEATESPRALADYFRRDEVQLAYQFSTVPALWEAVALGHARALPRALNPARLPPRGHWWVFSECHDQIILERANRAACRPLVRQLLASGAVPFGPPGAEPQAVCGTTSSLLRGDFRRIRLLWQLKLSLGWTPLFYLGEELGVENDLTYLQDRARRNDSRFVKRVALRRELKRKRHEPGSKEGFLFHTLRQWMSWRKAHPCLAEPPEFLTTGNPAVLAFVKRSPEERLVLAANCSEDRQAARLKRAGAVTLEPFEFRVWRE